MENTHQVRTRIAPSPTGFAHIGTIYQSLFDFAFARKMDGKFIVRIEDTDRVRFVEGAEKVIFDSLDWFGLIPDEDPLKGGPFTPYRQSERLEVYKEYIDELLQKGHAYYCFCSKERLERMRQEQETAKLPSMYDKHCLSLSEADIAENIKKKTPFVVRMKIPENETIIVEDHLLGKVEFDSNLIDHQIILKADGFPTYHLAVVVDDYLMKITHIFRGREWMPSTPKHILLYRYFGWQVPKYIHLPLILNSDGKGKLSKRQGHASVELYKQEGFLPEAILNYLSNIVWNHPDGKEIYPLDEFIKLFEIKQIKSQGPRFDLLKLEWINGEYIRKMPDEKLAQRLEEYLVDHPAKLKIKPLIPLVKERIKKLSDFIPLTHFIFTEPEYDIAVFQKLKIDNPAKALTEIVEALKKIPKPWNAKTFEETFRQLAQGLNLSASQIFQLIRVSVSGQLVTPPLFESIEIIGEEQTINRLEKLIKTYFHL